MKIRKPAVDLEVCDFCQCDGYLQTCAACGRQYCLSDEGHVGKSWGFTELCRQCAGRMDVAEICAKYAAKLTPIFRARNRALKRLRGPAE
jgi:hypothetical protein